MLNILRTEWVKRFAIEVSSTYIKIHFLVSALLQHKENFKELDAAETARLQQGQKDHLDFQIRKFRRRRLIMYHDLEQDLLREVKAAIFDIVVAVSSRGG